VTIGTLQVRTDLATGASRKDKRRVLSSLKDRLPQQFNAAVAEPEYLDESRHTGFGVANRSLIQVENPPGRMHRITVQDPMIGFAGQSGSGSGGPWGPGAVHL